MRLALFDVDGTLVRSGSERALGRHLVRTGQLGPQQLVAYALGMVRLLPAAGIHVSKKNKCYLSGLDCEQVEALAAQFIAGWAPQHWLDPAVERLRSLQSRGDEIVLLSGTPDFILKPLAAMLGVRHFVGSMPARQAGRYVASLPALHPFADAKRSIAAKLVEQFGVEWRDVSAYGDSIYDLDLLERAGEPVAVGPDRRLRRVAVARGWEIIEIAAADPARAH